jgi:methyl-accepting chemotaxis protein
MTVPNLAIQETLMTRFSFRRVGRTPSIVGDIAAQAGKLGIEICDVSGHVEEVAARVQRQAQVCRVTDRRNRAGDDRHNEAT